VTNRVLLVGEAPNRATERRPELWLLPDRSGVPHSANRLLALSSLSLHEYLDAFERTNLLAFWPGKRADGHGDAWPLDEAQHAAVALLGDALRAGRSVVLLGSRVAKAFDRAIMLSGVSSEGRRGSLRARHFEFLRFSSGSLVASIASVPHPSGINRSWNERPELRGECARFFRAIVDRAGVRA
jgi:hypothetical protein